MRRTADHRVLLQGQVHDFKITQCRLLVIQITFSTSHCFDMFACVESQNQNIMYIYILICTYIYHKLDPSLKSNDFTELTYGTIDSSKSKQHQLQGVPGVDLPANMATQRSPISLIWLCATSNMCMIYIYMYIYWIYCTSYRHGIYSQIWVDSPSY